MTIIVVTLPAAILAAADIRAALTLGSDPADVVLNALASAAQSAVDGPQGTLRRAVGQQTLEVQLDDWSCHWRHGWPEGRGYDPDRWRAKLSEPERYYSRGIVLPFPPLVSITSVTYLDTDGSPQTLDPSQYGFTGVGSEGPGRILPAYGVTWPPTRCFPGAVKVRYVAGYSTCPPPIRQAMLMMIRNMLSMARDGTLRSETVDGVATQSFDTSAAAGQAMDRVVDALLSPFRVLAL